jgi:hypothetical protein
MSGLPEAARKLIEENIAIHRRLAALDRRPTSSELKTAFQRFERCARDMRDALNYIRKHPELLRLYIDACGSDDARARARRAFRLATLMTDGLLLLTINFKSIRQQLGRDRPGPKDGVLRSSLFGLNLIQMTFTGKAITLSKKRHTAKYTLADFAVAALQASDGRLTDGRIRSAIRGLKRPTQRQVAKLKRELRRSGKLGL